MKKPKEYQVMSGHNKATAKKLSGDELVDATAINLLITAALTRASLRELSALSPWLAQQYSSAIPVMEELMRFALSEMGLNLIPSLFALQKTLNFTFTGSLKILSDDDGIAIQLEDCELDVDSSGTTLSLNGED